MENFRSDTCVETLAIQIWYQGGAIITFLDCCIVNVEMQAVDQKISAQQVMFCISGHIFVLADVSILLHIIY